MTSIAPLILLVEDFTDTAADGHAAIEKTRALRPDLVLMDLSLPGIDGWEATRQLKADPATAHITILALSAHALAAEGDRARQAGCDGFIAKPCLPPELVDEMSRHLPSTRAVSAPSRAKPRPRTR
jgi:two-component system cell cycle response regulator DivK